MSGRWVRAGPTSRPGCLPSARAWELGPLSATGDDGRSWERRFPRFALEFARRPSLDRRAFLRRTWMRACLRTPKASARSRHRPASHGRPRLSHGAFRCWRLKPSIEVRRDERLVPPRAGVPFSEDLPRAGIASPKTPVNEPQRLDSKHLLPMSTAPRARHASHAPLPSPQCPGDRPPRNTKPLVITKNLGSRRAAASCRYLDTPRRHAAHRRLQSTHEHRKLSVDFLAARLPPSRPTPTPAQIERNAVRPRRHLPRFLDISIRPLHRRLCPQAPADDARHIVHAQYPAFSASVQQKNRPSSKKM